MIRCSLKARILAPIATVCVLSSGCVYYNGIYNAKSAAHRADLHLRAEADGEASTQFQLSAAKAESVLVRHPKSPWKVRALYLAGRGEAYSGQCERGVAQLDAFLRLANDAADAADRDRARVALGACELQTNRIADARARLDSLVDAHDPETARQARRWAARAALATGDRDAATTYLGATGSSVLQWELLTASLAANEYARAESLLVARAMKAEYRDEVTSAVRQLWSAGHGEAAERVVARYDEARVRDVHRVALHYALGELQLRAGRDSSARRHLLVAQELAGRDTAVSHEATARLSVMGLSRVSTLGAMDSLLAAQDSVVRRSRYGRRVAEQVLLARLLLQQQEANGASLFLAAEVARDSLRAVLLARTLFVQLARDLPASPLAARAWYAAALLQPDSASTWNARVLSGYATSSIARWLRGEDPSASPDYISSPELLRFHWDQTVRTWSDSVRKLRAPSRAITEVIRK